MPNVTLNLDDQTLARAKRHAESQCRSLSQQVAYLIKVDDEKRARRRKPRQKSAA